jgi:hypothetical protein
MAAQDEDERRDSGEVSETSGLAPEQGEQPIAPQDATAGYPESESGAPEEGTAGPDAPPRHGRPEPANESSR